MSEVAKIVRVVAGCVAFFGCLAILLGEVDLGVTLAAAALVAFVVQAVLW